MGSAPPGGTGQSHAARCRYPKAAGTCRPLGATGRRRQPDRHPDQQPAGARRRQGAEDRPSTANTKATRRQCPQPRNQPTSVSSHQPATNATTKRGGPMATTSSNPTIAPGTKNPERSRSSPPHPGTQTPRAYPKITRDTGRRCGLQGAMVGAPQHGRDSQTQAPHRNHHTNTVAPDAPGRPTAARPYPTHTARQAGKRPRAPGEAALGRLLYGDAGTSPAPLTWCCG